MAGKVWDCQDLLYNHSSIKQPLNTSSLLQNKNLISTIFNYQYDFNINQHKTRSLQTHLCIHMWYLHLFPHSVKWQLRCLYNVTCMISPAPLFISVLISVRISRISTLLVLPSVCWCLQITGTSIYACDVLYCPFLVLFLTKTHTLIAHSYSTLPATHTSPSQTHPLK